MHGKMKTLSGIAVILAEVFHTMTSDWMCDVQTAAGAEGGERVTFPAAAAEETS